MANLDNSELIHAFGDSWKNHKYIKKIGNRYFYSMDELRNYRDNIQRGKTGPTSKTTVAKKRQVGTIGSTGAFKKKRSIGDVITSGVKSAGKTFYDVTGQTDRKRAEAMEQLSGFLAKETASSKKELDTAVQNQRNSELAARKMREKAQLYDDEAALSKYASDYKTYSREAASDRKAANTETEDAKAYRQLADQIERDGYHYGGNGADVDRMKFNLAAPETLRKMADDSDSKNREQYTESAKRNEALAGESKKKLDTYTSEADRLRSLADQTESEFGAVYSRDVASAQRKYEADLTAYDAVVSEAQAYREKYGNSVSGKLEKAANDLQRTYNDVVQSASDAIDAGRQFAKKTVSKVQTGTVELITKASDTVASGLAWVESVFAPRKKK